MWTTYTITNTPETPCTIWLFVVELPARVRVVLMGLVPSEQVMTVPFSIASGVAVTLRVETKFNEPKIVEFGVTEVRVAVKTPRTTTTPNSNWVYLIKGLNASLLHSSMTPPTTMHVRVTSSPGQIAPWALEVSVTTPPACMDTVAGKRFGYIVNYIQSIWVHATECQTADHLTLAVTGWGARL